jgi:hypothetical protein
MPINEINRFRVDLGLKPIIRKITPCVSCRKSFESFDYPRQRMCLNCRGNEDNASFSAPIEGEQDLIA